MLILAVIAGTMPHLYFTILANPKDVNRIGILTLKSWYVLNIDRKVDTSQVKFEFCQWWVIGYSVSIFFSLG